MSALLLSTWSFGTVANAAGWPVLRAGGNALDAVVAGATAVENDETIDCVGVGGTPDAQGQVTLDACVTTDPDRCGAVACVRSYPNPSAIARRVMERTSHFLLVGAGAEEFAAREQFLARNLLTEAARARWEAWRSAAPPCEDRPCRDAVLPVSVEGPRGLSTEQARRAGHDTVCVLARDDQGRLAGACSTSGMPFKAPGRVGDSPIIGHGVYVDQQAGAATATGNGELIMGICGSFLVVEEMRRGADPLSGCVAALSRIADRFHLCPDHQVAFLAIAPRARGGVWASAALRPGFLHVVTDDAGTRVEPPHAVLLP